MSGIFGIVNADGSPVASSELSAMRSLLERRGPDGAGAWHEGAAGLGHTLLATTPEGARETLPLVDPASGCVITADARLDNRAELLAALGMADRAADTGDAALILAAWLAWGPGCPARLLGDFAFAIWDPRQRTLFCARDHMGLRPFCYHHSPGRLFAFASEPRAILVLPRVPYRLNEGRIADYIVEELEGIDKTSTFFEEVFRLPPAHALTLGAGGLAIGRYWAPVAGPELRLPSDRAYAEAFLDVFTEAVRCRLRGAGPVGSMLSGGMDSGSVVAVARRLRAQAGAPPLPTFSATSPDAEHCVETRAIRAALTMDGLDPTVVHHGQLPGFLPEIADLSLDLDEPFDRVTLVRVMDLAARRKDVRVLLDGAGGDMVLAPGTYLVRLLRSGRWIKGFREAIGWGRFFGRNREGGRRFVRAVLSAFAPDSLRRFRDAFGGPRRVRRRIRESLIHPDFARRIDLAGRLRTLDGPPRRGRRPSPGEEHAAIVDQAYLTAGRERYARIAAATGVEPRDPFLDRRVVEFCLALPDGQKLQGGWPKIILRRAMEGLLPDDVRWRRGKQHLGWDFTRALLQIVQNRMPVDAASVRSLSSPYFSKAGVDLASAIPDRPPEDLEQAFHLVHLALWLSRHSQRPVPPATSSR